MHNETMMEDEPSKNATYGVQEDAQVSEEFKSRVHDLVKDVTPAELAYIKSCCEPPKPEEPTFSDKEMPKD